MAYTPNNISDEFLKQFKRQPTDFEFQTYKNSSPQTLANLGDTYAKYNTTGSVVDLLKYKGMDSSFENRQKLAQQYGIQGYGSIGGTADQNKSLHNAIMGGQNTPTPQNTTPVSGSVSGASQPTTGDATASPTVPDSSNPSVSGSVTGASGSPTDSTANPAIPKKPEADPAVATALQSYQNTQKQVNDIDNALESALQAKKDEVTRSGGIVDEAQLRSIVASEKAPLLQQRSQLTREQATSGKYYQTLLQQQKEKEANYYRDVSSMQKQQAQGFNEQLKTGQFELQQQKQNSQEEQFTQKEKDVARRLDQSGWKSVSTTSYDEYGNINGKGQVWKQNPSDKIGVDAKGNVVQTVMNNSGQMASVKVPTQADAPSTAKLTTDRNININSPGYTTSMVMFQGKNTQLTQSYIDQIAIAGIMNGGTIPSGSVRSGKGLPILQSDTIKARMGQLDPGGNLALNKAQAQAWGKTISKQIDYASTLNRSLQSADADFQQIITKYDKTGINDKTMPLSNVFANFKKYNLGSGEVSAFKASLSELSRLYSQVFSSTGRTTDATNKTAQDIIDGNISIENLKLVASQLQALGKIDVDKANESVKGAESSFRNISGQPSASSKGAMSNSDFVEKSLSSHNLNYDEVIKQYTPTLDKGERLAVDNETGNVIAVNDSDDKSKYTPL